MCCPDATVPIKANYKSGYRPQWAIFHLGCNDEMSSNCDKSLSPLCFGDELLTIKTCRESLEDTKEVDWVWGKQQKHREQHGAPETAFDRSLMPVLISCFQLINVMNICEISTFLLIYSIFPGANSSLYHVSALHMAGSQMNVQGHYWIKAILTSKQHSNWSISNSRATHGAAGIAISKNVNR